MAGRKPTIFFLGATSRKHKRPPRHKLNLKPHEVVSKAEVGVRPMLEEARAVVAKDEEVLKVDQEGEEEASLLIGEPETLLEQDEEEEGPQLRRTETCGFI